MSNVIVTNPFDQAFRKEILSSSNFTISELKSENYSLNLNNIASEPNSAESVKVTVTNFVSDQEELLEDSDFNYLTKLNNKVDDSGNSFSHSLKSDIQNALIKKMKCQTKKVGSKFGGCRHQSHTNIKLPFPLDSERYHNCNNNNNNNNNNYSPSDSDSKRKNRDAAKKSRQRKKLYIAQLEKQIHQFKKNEKGFQSKLRDAEKTIQYLNNVIVQLRKNESDSLPNADFDK